MSDDSTQELEPPPEKVCCVADAIRFAKHWTDVENWGASAKEIARSYQRVGFWFRGLPDHSFRLTPSVLRAQPAGGEYYDETSMYYDFSMGAFRELDEQSSGLSRLALMQHYNLPTRLLDWTTNVLVALFFAIVDDHSSSNLITAKYKEKNGKLVVLHARALNYETSLRSVLYPELFSGLSSHLFVPREVEVILRCTFARVRGIPGLLECNELDAADEADAVLARYVHELRHAYYDRLTSARDGKTEVTGSDIRSSWEDHPRWNEFVERLAMPVAVYPEHGNGRIMAQFGMFTVHGGKSEPSQGVPEGLELPRPKHIEEVEAESRKRERDNRPIVHLTESALVPKGKKEEILSELDSIGINRMTLFPDLDHRSKHIARRWDGKTDQTKH